ncbi:MAG TPA: DNA polymerase III subunit beta [Vicinamibacteria bacterium]|nr:DNA polymerase III subunit beta [Vicinamibacteria bacterium]
MEFTARKDELLRELSLIQGIVERKNTIPVLANVLIDAQDSEVELAATDLDVGLRSRFPAKVKKAGSLTLSAKKLFEIVRAVTEPEIELKELENFWASITSGKSYFKMVGLAKADFPTLAEPPKEPASVIPGGVLREMIRKTSFAITADDSRYFLNGARLEIGPQGFRMVATDGHRLAYIEVKVKRDSDNGSLSVTVPKKTLLELLKVLGESEGDVLFSQSENHLFFRVQERLLVSKRVEDQFPAYDKVIPKDNDKVVVCRRDALGGALRRVSLLANERSRAVRFAIKPELMEISSQNPELGEAKEELGVDYAGEGLQVGFNGQYILDFLGVEESESVRLELKDDSSQCLLRPSDAGKEIDYRYVVMPMRT